MICNFILYYFLKSFREHRERSRRRSRRAAKGLKLKKVEKKDVEKNVDVVDGIDEEDDDFVEPTERPIISRVIMIWALFEVLSLVLSLIFMVEEGFKNNFLSEICYDRDKACRRILNRIIYYKLLVSVTLLIGAKYVS